MNCKRCGKALGTDRGICPFCGSLLSKEQMDSYKRYQQAHQFEAKMVTEKYGMKPVYYEKANNNENKVIGFIVVLAILIVLAFIVLFVVLN